MGGADGGRALARGQGGCGAVCVASGLDGLAAV